MKKTITLILLLFIGIANSQTTLIPDSNFEQALINSGIDSDGVINGQVLTSDVSNLTNLSVPSYNISDLTGIEDFVNLTDLAAFNNNISSIDLSNNTQLRVLYIDTNNLTAIDLTNNTQLQTVWLGYNNITAIDITNLTNLYTFKIEHNDLTSLDLSNKTINLVECDNNLITNLNVTNSGISELICYNNRFTTLDISNTGVGILNCSNTNISTLNTTGKNFYSLDVSSTNISSLDLSSSSNLQSLLCSYTNITSLDLSNTGVSLDLVDFNGCNSLTEMNVKNGYNTSISTFNGYGTPNLSCIEVDDAAWSTTNWVQVDSGVTFSEDCSTLSTNDLVMEDMKFYPNPVSTSLNVNTKEDLSYSIIDITGKQLKSGELSNGLNNIDLSTVSSGLLFIKINNSDSVVLKKILKN
ncbi:MAG: T9SS type A sorting domain-containing protein [Flavobacteriaceae bacterium]